MLVLCTALVPSPALAQVTPASTAPQGERLSLVLPLAYDRAGLARFAASVSTPGSPLYGHYRSIAWLSAHFGASARTRARVTSFLRAHGATHVRVDATGLFARATLTVARAEQLFDTSLSAHRSARGDYTAPALPARIPRPLQGLVRGVVGLDTQPVYTAPESVEPSGVGGADLPASSGYAGPDGDPRGCAGALATNGFTPNEYLTAYRYTPLHQIGVRGQGERVALIEIDGFAATDVVRFASCFDLHVPPIDAFPVGLAHLLPPAGEATLDLEVLDAAASHLRSIDVYETRADAAHVLEALSAPLQSFGEQPDVISVSLGLCEADTLNAVGRAGIDASESALEEAAADGISVLAASGDTGSSGCTSTVGRPVPLPQLAVTYPASSPWVTSVGGTNLTLGPQNEIVNQVVWNDAGQQPGAAGGGGFSTLFKRPGYQDGLFVHDRRAVPDLALLADVSPGYAVYCDARIDCAHRRWMTFGGTSAATPLLAGGLALVDQMLHARNLQPLGLVNPLLYRFARHPPHGNPVVDDVTQGSNDVGPFLQPQAAPLGCCSARPGYDAASGWGGIDLDTFAQDVEAVEPPVAEVTMVLPAGQHPLASGEILARVHCSRVCDAAVRAKLTISHRPSFFVYAKPVGIRSGASYTVALKLSPAQLETVVAAAKRHLRITAAVTAALVDPSGNILRQTPTITALLAP